MTQKIIKGIIAGLLLLILVGGGFYWWATRSQNDASPGPIVGWGSIESETIAITAEIPERIVALHAGEGDEVEPGQLLVELDPATLRAERQRLEKGVARAEANLAEVSAPPRPEAVSAAEANLAEIRAARDGAEVVWQVSQNLVNNPLELQTQVDRLAGQIAQLEKDVEAAQANLKTATIERDQAFRNQSSDEAITTYQAAEQRVDAAEGSLAAAEARLAGTQQRLELLTAIRNNPLDLVARRNAAQTSYDQAAAMVGLAQAELAATRAPARPERVNIAEAQRRQAEAALEGVDVQLEKLTITAPAGGVILERSVEVGELATPSLILMEIGTLDQVTLEVFIPETQIGRVQLGQRARVEVDAYPDRTFEGRVTRIAQEAEFTPQNVQTKENRVNLVFAVEISLDNPNHALRPGMPARAEISPGSRSTPTIQPSPAASSTPPASPASESTATPTATETALSPTRTPTPAEATPQATPRMEAEVVSWALNVRRGPGLDHPVSGGLQQGEVVPVLEVNPGNGWLKIRLPDSEETGWITGKAEYVAINGNIKE